jgi:hypothetical protein
MTTVAAAAAAAAAVGVVVGVVVVVMLQEWAEFLHCEPMPLRCSQLDILLLFTNFSTLLSSCL